MKQKFIDSIEYIALFILIIALTVIIGYLVNRFFKRLIAKSTEEMKNDPTNYLFLRHLVVGLIYVVGISIAIYAMPNLRALASSLLAGAGILAVAVGFASQHALSNIISGLFIVVFKPFRVNDRIKLRDLVGFIEDITLRHTVIRDFENNRIVIPNALISDEIIVNSDIADQKICKWINVGISYDSSIEKAKQIIREEILNHPLHIDPRTPEQIEEGVELAPVRVMRFGESSVDLRGWAWAKDAADGFLMECALLESIKLRFDAEGVEIPFPHRTLVYKNSKNPDNTRNEQA
jgi:small conductance mechanosensitive channel